MFESRIPELDAPVTALFTILQPVEDRTSIPTRPSAKIALSAISRSMDIGTLIPTKFDLMRLFWIVKPELLPARLPLPIPRCSDQN